SAVPRAASSGSSSAAEPAMTVLSPRARLSPPRRDSAVRHVALAGNPNSGKTTLFNALTGLRQTVANYPGVTVDKKEGALRLDASNLERNLYLALQIADLGVPVIVVLNMMDVAERHGLRVDPAALSRQIGLPVVPAVASRGRGLPELYRLLREGITAPPAPRRDPLPPDAEEALEALARGLGAARGLAVEAARARAAALLTVEDAPPEPEVARAVDEARRRF